MRISFLLLLLLPCIHSFSSEKSDSLKALLNKTTDEAGMALFTEIGEYYIDIDTDSAVHYLQFALDIASERNDSSFLFKTNYKLGKTYRVKRNGRAALEYLHKAIEYIDTGNVSPDLAPLYYEIGAANYYFSDRENSVKYLKKSRELYAVENDSIRLAMCQFLLGDVSYRNGRVQDAFLYHQKGLSISREINYELGLAKSYMCLGEIYTMWGNYESAMNYYTEATSIFEDLKDTIRLAGTYIRIGMMMGDWKDYEEALSNYKKAISLYTAVDYKHGLAAATNNLAVLYQNQGKPEMAVSVLKGYLVEYQDHLNPKTYALAYKNLGDAYDDLDKSDSALHYLQKSQELFREQKNERRLAYGYRHLAMVYIKKGDYKIAKELLKKSLDYGEKSGMPHLILSAVRGHIWLYEKTGDYYNAYNSLDQYQKLNDSIFNRESHDKFAQIHASYENERKEKEIALLNKEKELQSVLIREKDAAMKRQNVALWAGGLFILLILSLLFILLLQIQKKIRAYDQLEKYNKEIIEGRKQLIEAKEKAEEMERLKSAFITNISHEIRTPMSVILGYVNLLHSEEYSSSERKEFIRLININGENLLNIIDDILSISKIESGITSIDNETFDLHMILEELKSNFNQYKEEIGKGNIEIDFSEPDKETIVYSDKGKFKQIFSNLIHNAIKFTEEGKLEFGQMKENGRMVYYVKDTGIGIPEEEQQHIFKRFRQVDNSLTRKYGGTGLGLAIVKNLVGLLDGEIWCKSTAGKGTTFYFTLGDNGMA